MPGPVSQSSYPFPELKDLWLEDLEKNGLKFFVLKAEDFLSALDEDEVEQFNDLLKKHEQWRLDKGKKSSNKYWVCNRDEPYAEEVRKLIFGDEK